MTRKLIRISLLLMSAVMGWTFGFIKLPYVERNDSFWVGFVSCLAVIAFAIALFGNWNYQKAIKLFAPFSRGIDMHKVWILKNKLLLSIFFIAVLIFCIFSYFSTRAIHEKLYQAYAEIEELKHDDNLEQQRNKLSLLLELINRLDSTKVYAAGPSAVELMLDRIVSLSSSFKIHKEWDLENKVFESVSTERGLLLLALVRTKMDSNSFQKIKENVSFAGADLRNADFSGLNLSGIDLNNSNLEYANLQGVNLNNANLNNTRMLGVNLNHAYLVGANLTSAKLNWAKVNETDFQMAKLDSADFSNATAQKSKLNHASLVKTVLCNSIFIEADFNYCLMMSVNLSNANFSRARLTTYYIYNMNFGDPILNDAIIRDHWTEQLKERNNFGLNKMLEKYSIICDSLTFKDSVIYKLTPNTL